MASKRPPLNSFQESSSDSTILAHILPSEPTGKLPPTRHTSRPPESTVGNIRLLTEKHPEWLQGEPRSPSHRVPNLLFWNKLRPCNHQRFQHPAILAAWLRMCADNAEQRALQGLPNSIKWVKEQLDALSPRAKLPATWAGFATMAFEVAINAIWSWTYDVNGTPLSVVKGRARRISFEPLSPKKWEPYRVQQRPYWLLETETGTSLIVPDWFWATYPIKTLMPIGSWGDCEKIVGAIAVEYMTDLLAALTEDKNALAMQPEVIKKWLCGASPAHYGLANPPGKLAQIGGKLVREEFRKIDTSPLMNSPFWMPKITAFDPWQDR